MKKEKRMDQAGGEGRAITTDWLYIGVRNYDEENGSLSRGGGPRG